MHSSSVFDSVGASLSLLSLQGSKEMSFVFRVVYTGQDVISEGRVILFFAPSADPQPRFEIFELEDLRPLFAKDIVSKTGAVNLAEMLRIDLPKCPHTCVSTTAKRPTW